MIRDRTPPYTAVILAAGRGSRLGNLTDRRPKCLVGLGGRTLLERQIAALARAGVSRTLVVTGYRHELIEAEGVETIHYGQWHSTNMVGSLMCALGELPAPLVVSYGDIIYSPQIVKRLMQSPGDCAITYDSDWLSFWHRRFADPLSDAETFRISPDGLVQEIGGKTDDLADIEGQFMGLMKFSPAAVARILDLLAAEPPLRVSLDSTGLLKRLIDGGTPVRGVPTRGGWCEVDSPRDLAVARQLMLEGKL